MAKKLETSFKEKVVERLKELPNTWFTKTQQASIRGTPDIILCVDGMFVALELKSAIAKTPSKLSLQWYNIDKINQANGLGIIVAPENWIKVLNVLKKLSKGEHYDRDDIRAITR